MRAMILAAGLGTRMRPLTDHCPKPLLPVADKPLIVHLIERLVAAGFDQLVINVSHLAEQIQAALGDGSRWGAQIRYSVEPQPLETAGGIIQALPLLTQEQPVDQPFLVVNGDIWCEQPLQRLPQQIEGLAHLLLVPNPEHNPEGDFGLQQQRVTLDPPRLTFSGISMLRPSLFDGCLPGAQPLAPLLLRAIEQGQVSGQRCDDYWLDVGTPRRLELLNQRLQAKD
jgi:MurNAc alpha-1-phosphate uridylyltransferase